ncbi:MAG: pantetheine-phosphate adenylyltransferase [Ignavibacteriae bacterium]|nr:pantetheine-phosphate adenylyltransferase [Ignavibacteria bacterium]MBI3365068.1 pantetheine-phosphate adenylyltransferase [Ignavibacteriota bacterium]
MKIAIYPGTFDPITYGHLDVIERAAEIFDRVIVTVARNTIKQPLCTEEERMTMIRDAVKKYKKVSVDCFEGLLVAYAKQKKATAIVRGLRAVSDFEYEFQMALMNRKLDGAITTVFLMPHEKYTYLNSSIVREIARFGGDISEFVPPGVQKLIEKKLIKQ